jgi:carbonic anhydrase/acetyltransferase-like protein (isoleucine patch superfamily)
VGSRTNIQDLSVVHVTTDTADAHIGSDVTIGHRAILHGCTIADHVLVGMGAIILDHAEIGDFCIVGAGAVVPPGKRILAGSLVLGSPARVLRAVTDAERALIEQSARRYVDLAAAHASQLGPAQR